MEIDGVEPLQSSGASPTGASPSSESDDGADKESHDNDSDDLGSDTVVPLRRPSNVSLDSSSAAGNRRRSTYELENSDRNLLTDNSYQLIEDTSSDIKQALVTDAAKSPEPEKTRSSSKEVQFLEHNLADVREKIQQLSANDFEGFKMEYSEISLIGAKNPAMASSKKVCLAGIG